MQSVTRRARSFELVPVSTCDAIMAADARLLCSGESYSANSLSYYVAVNTWMIQISDYCGGVWREVLRVCVDSGLRPVVLRFAAAADELVRGSFPTDPLVSSVLAAVTTVPQRTCFSHLPVATGVLAVRLQICRYLKRMNLQNADVLDAQLLSGFMDNQERLRWEWDQPATGEKLTVLREVANALESSLDWTAVNSILGSFSDPSARSFTAGAASETGRSMARKFEVMARQNPLFFNPIMGSYGFPFPEREFIEEFVQGQNRYCSYPLIGYDLLRQHIVNVTCVPKGIKGPRIIATEPLQHQTFTKWCQQRLYRLLPPLMNLNDQEPNQYFALQGSGRGTFATIDLSAASDSVTKALVDAILPRDTCLLLARLAPTDFSVAGGVYPLMSYATMGNGLTFWLESITFWGVAASVVPESEHCLIRVYGDDIVVPTGYAEQVIHRLQLLGFEVNEAKTFTSGPYRESCGVEGFNGLALPSIYYPRFPVAGEVTEHTCVFKADPIFINGVTDDTTLRAVKLQQRLWGVSVGAAVFMTAVVRDAHPDMTTSLVGCDEAQDLWGLDEFHPEVPELYATRVVRAFRDHGVVHPLTEYPDSLAAHPDDAIAAGLEPVWSAPIVESGRTRPTAYLPKVQRNGVVSELSKNLYECYRYWQYLREGPMPLYEGDSPDWVGGFLTQPRPRPGAALKDFTLGFGRKPLLP